MAKYFNKRTGATIEVASIVSGGNWVEVIKEVTEKEIKETVEEEKDGIDGITVKEIKQELDAFGIKYNPKAKKQELYDLMMQGR